jgi:hypothetical protein
VRRIGVEPSGLESDGIEFVDCFEGELVGGTFPVVPGKCFTSAGRVMAIFEEVLPAVEWW